MIDNVALAKNVAARYDGWVAKGGLVVRYILIYLEVINVIALILCICDKRAAINKRRRISEKTLFAAALVGGSAGLYIGMLIARHKTRQRRFMVLVPIIIGVQAAILVLLMV